MVTSIVPAYSSCSHLAAHTSEAPSASKPRSFRWRTAAVQAPAAFLRNTHVATLDASKPRRPDILTQWPLWPKHHAHQGCCGHTVDHSEVLVSPSKPAKGAFFTLHRVQEPCNARATTGASFQSVGFPAVALAFCIG